MRVILLTATRHKSLEILKITIRMMNWEKRVFWRLLWIRLNHINFSEMRWWVWNALTFLTTRINTDMNRTSTRATPALWLSYHKLEPGGTNDCTECGASSWSKRSNRSRSSKCCGQWSSLNDLTQKKRNIGEDYIVPGACVHGWRFI